MLSMPAKQRLLQMLYLEEKYSQFAYDDANSEIVRAPKGNLTIGIGWNIQTNGCPREIAEYAALYFIAQNEKSLANKIPFYNSLSDVRTVVLCDMAFNMGVNNVLEFKNMLACMASQDWKAAAQAMLKSKWAMTVGQRAVNLSKMMETGTWI